MTETKTLSVQEIAPCITSNLLQMSLNLHRRILFIDYVKGETKINTQEAFYTYKNVFLSAMTWLAFTKLDWVSYDRDLLASSRFIMLQRMQQPC